MLPHTPCPCPCPCPCPRPCPCTNSQAMRPYSHPSTTPPTPRAHARSFVVNTITTPLSRSASATFQVRRQHGALSCTPSSARCPPTGCCARFGRCPRCLARSSAPPRAERPTHGAAHGAQRPAAAAITVCAMSPRPAAHPLAAAHASAVAPAALLDPLRPLALSGQRVALIGSSDAKARLGRGRAAADGRAQQARLRRPQARVQALAVA